MNKYSWLANYIKLLRTSWRMRNTFVHQKTVFSHSFEELSTSSLIREDFILQLSIGKRVLHFGFADAPFTKRQLDNKGLLHRRLAEVAEYLYGIDLHDQAIADYQRWTGDANCAAYNIEDSPEHYDFLTNKYELLLFPEILEHLRNPGLALQNLRSICLRNEGCIACFTVPNAFFAGGFFAAMEGKEIVHPDHYYYFSPNTLKKLLIDTGFKDIKLHFYSSPDLQQIPGLTKNGVIATAVA